jgi:hypothetical protein
MFYISPQTIATEQTPGTWMPIKITPAVASTTERIPSGKPMSDYYYVDSIFSSKHFGKNLKNKFNTKRYSSTGNFDCFTAKIASFGVAL